MHGHEIDGVGGIDDRVRLVATGHQLGKVVCQATERGVAAVLDAADQAPNLLQVLARLREPGAADLHRIGRFGEHTVHHFGRRQLIGNGDPRGHAVAHQ